MSDTSQKFVHALSSPVIMSFPNLFEAKAFKDKRTGKENGEPKFSANLILSPDHPDLATLKALAGQAARSMFPTTPFSELAFPFASGTKLCDERQAETGKLDREYQRGMVVIAARSKFRPTLAIIVGGKIIDLNDASALQNKDKFYPGVQILAQVTMMPYKVGSNKPGVTAYLNSVLSLNKGERIAGGAVSAAEAFSGYVGTVSHVDPTSATGLDDISF